LDLLHPHPRPHPHPLPRLPLHQSHAAME